ncbi:hypothetical protein B0H10DRAFT_2056078, partial [Mycena sp. CBHHK59/15]
MILGVLECCGPWMGAAPRHLHGTVSQQHLWSILRTSGSVGTAIRPPCPKANCCLSLAMHPTATGWPHHDESPTYPLALYSRALQAYTLRLWMESLRAVEETRYPRMTATYKDPGVHPFGREEETGNT